MHGRLPSDLDIIEGSFELAIFILFYQFTFTAHAVSCIISTMNSKNLRKVQEESFEHVPCK